MRNAPSAPRYKLAIFDFDGTLADSGDWFLSIADELADRFNFKHVTPEEVEMLRGKTSRDVIRYLGIPRWRLPGMARYIHRRLADQTDQIALFEGVATMLETLVAGGVRVAVVTSNAEDNARAILGPVNVARIEMFECGASLFGKAARFKKVLRKTGVALTDAISIGDETRDLAAARKVGIDGAAVVWGYANYKVLMAMAPDMVFNAPSEVTDFLLHGAAVIQQAQR